MVEAISDGYFTYSTRERPRNRCLSPLRLRSALFPILMPTSSIITTSRLGHRFGRRVLFRKMDLQLVGGTTTAITGPNGSGKSTLVRILAGVLTPAKGFVELTLEGKKVEDEVRPLQCGLVAPYLNVYDGFSPRENLQFLATVRGFSRRDPRIDEVLERVQLASRADDMVHTFSSGMIQRMRLACALVSDPPVLLLDEPTATLDSDGVSIVRSVIDDALERGKLVLVATNEPREAEACQHRVDIRDYC